VARDSLQDWSQRAYPGGFVLWIDRSAAAIAQARRGSQEQMASARLEYRQAEIESFELAQGEQPFDLAFALRVGALDGRHPANESLALACLRKTLTPNARLYIDGGAPLREIRLCRRE
jgi:2-polyprenyl-3-methyl-5-hydroxy-6-metoxy-1,4-benzoquinol methylase